MTIILNKAVSTYGVLMVFYLITHTVTSYEMVETRLSTGVDGRNPETLKGGKVLLFSAWGKVKALNAENKSYDGKLGKK